MEKQRTRGVVFDSRVWSWVQFSIIRIDSQEYEAHIHSLCAKGKGGGVGCRLSQ